jgi:hypothetical protein
MWPLWKISSFLQRPPRPVGEHRLPRVEHGLVEEGDRGEERETNVLTRIAGAPSFLFRGAEHRLHVRAERFGIRRHLAIGPQPRHGGERLLERESQSAAAGR